jgi:hypothetical protein
MSMYEMNQLIEIINHSEPACNGQYGTITHIETAYDGRTHYYTVQLEDTIGLCVCTEDEMMEA